MTMPEIDRALQDTLADHRLSRSERQAMKLLFKEMAETDCQRTAIRCRAFEIARQEVIDPTSCAVLDWLEEVNKLLQPKPISHQAPAEAYFSPGDDCPAAIVRHLHAASRQIDICVYTITDDRIARAILDAHGRGVAVRIITDIQKVQDCGSDIERLQHSGIAVRTDDCGTLMHHKFALFDERTLLTGSYNWTHSAASGNLENFIVTDEPPLVQKFVLKFEELWQSLI